MLAPLHKPACTSELKHAFSWVTPEGESVQQFQVQVVYLKGDPRTCQPESGEVRQRRESSQEKCISKQAITVGI